MPKRGPAKNDQVSGKRRKGQEDLGLAKKRVKTSNEPKSGDIQSQIASLESSISESRANYNKIITLLGYLDDRSISNQGKATAAVAICRVFCKLLAVGECHSSKVKPENESKIAKWLDDRILEFEDALLRMLDSTNQQTQCTALTLTMRLLKERAKSCLGSGEPLWLRELSTLINSLARNPVAAAARDEFNKNYVAKYADVRYQTLTSISQISQFADSETYLPQVLSILHAMDFPNESSDEPPDVYFSLSPKRTRDMTSMSAQKKQAQKAWVYVLHQELSKSQRKDILDRISRQIAPWFIKIELLMDFLTDSFNIGGSSSLMALSGLFHLMQTKNLDYPQFYFKLYSLLDSQILHSKHRSRFFRLLDTFLGSTHLPAALVASFIKRLSRLSLQAPPSGIVAVVPLVYNLLKNHPTCTFMIHRNAPLENKDEGRWGDPFVMDEDDPMETGAIDSSLWELHTLQSHYHPNVAAIAKIISEQFTKQAYNIEDFLDHSYSTMIDAELSKKLKKPPEVEYEIPKRIFRKGDADATEEGSLLVRLWDFS